MKKLPVVAGVATALVGLSVPVVLMMTDSADALSGRLADDDTERTMSCGQALVELNVDKEATGFEVDGDVDNAKAGSTWKVVLRHDGDRGAEPAPSRPTSRATSTWRPCVRTRPARTCSPSA